MKTRLALIVLVISTSVASGPSALARQGPSDGKPSEEWTRLRARLRTLSEKYGFEIVAAEAPGRGDKWTSYEAARPGDCLPYADLLDGELGRYPPDLFQRAGMKRILLCSRIQHDGGFCGGYTVRFENLVYLDPTWPDPSVRRHALHHELFHVLDDAICWDKSRRRYVDRTWETLNRPGFSYRVMGGPEAAHPGLDDSEPGFLTGYSRRSVEEDKAELFAWMMARPDVVDQRQRNDQRLAAKAVQLKRVLKQYHPAMDDHFWPGGKSAASRPGPGTDQDMLTKP